MSDTSEQSESAETHSTGLEQGFLDKIKSETKKRSDRDFLDRFRRFFIRLRSLQAPRRSGIEW